MYEREREKERKIQANDTHAKHTRIHTDSEDQQESLKENREEGTKLMPRRDVSSLQRERENETRLK